MAETLYRKYRPQTFADIHEQEHIKITLQNEIAQGSIAHGYVFSGPRGVGKTTTARVFAKALNCLESKKTNASATSAMVEPCNVCQNCKEITSGRSLDVVEIDAASHSGVDNVREQIIEAIRFPPANGKYKIFIIDEAHMLSTAAWNALLKTLEEPPMHAVFILASTELHKFPETILSRCQRFEFKKLKPAEQLAKLKDIAQKEGVTIDEDVLRSVVRKSEGGMRDAESLLGQLFAMGGTTITPQIASTLLPTTSNRAVAEFLVLLAQKQTTKALQAVENLIQTGADISAFAAEVVAGLRLVLVSRATGDWSSVQSAYDANSFQEIQSAFSAIAPQQVVRMLEALIKTARDVKTADIAQLPLEIAIVTITTDAPTAPPQAAPTSSNPPAPTHAAPVSQNVPSSQAPSVRAAQTVSMDPPPTSTPTAPKSTATSYAAALAKSLQEYQSKWQEVIAKVEEQSRSLPFILKLATPTAVIGNEVHLAFQYPFHADTFNKDANRRLVEAAMLAVMGESCKCIGLAVSKPQHADALGEVSPVETAAVQVPKLDTKIKSVLDDFGGKIVA